MDEIIDEKIITYMPGPIKLMIDRTRYVIIDRPITIQLNKLKSYFEEDPIATIQVTNQLIRENERVFEEFYKINLPYYTQIDLLTREQHGLIKRMIPLIPERRK